MKDKGLKGYKDGLYISRYYANKAKTGDQIAVKVCGGYKLMTYQQYRIWRTQK